MSKAGLANFLVRTNAFAPFRWLNSVKLPVLMYHRFSENDEYGKTSRKTFETHLNYLTRNYNVIALGEAVSRLNSDGEFPPRSVVITVDDGYRDFYEIAFPVLKKLSVPATLYVVTDFIEGNRWIWTDKARFISLQTKRENVSFSINGKVIDRKFEGTESRLIAAGAINTELKKLSDEAKDELLLDLSLELGVEIPELPPDELGPLNWEQAKMMEGNRIDIGSHTVSHPILTNTEGDRLASELERSRVVIQDRMQKENVHFCYPNGNVGKRERDAAEAAGYASAVTTEIRLCENKDDKFLIPRIDAEPDLHRFVQATSGFDRFKSRIR